MKLTGLILTITIALVLLLTPTLLGQATGSNKSAILWETDPPTSVQTTTISAQLTGTPGSQQYYYWVVANYPIGDAFPGGPLLVRDVPDTLNGVDFLTLRWGGVSGATSYDLLRTTTATFPSGIANVAVATGIAAVQQVDQANAVAAYTLAATQRAIGFMRLDNKDEVVPTFLVEPGLDITGNVNITGNLAVTGTFSFDALTQGSVIFVGPAGGLTEDNAEFFFDDTNDFLGIGTNVPISDLHVLAAADTEILVESTGNDAFLMLDPAAANSAFVAIRRGVGGEVWQLGMDGTDGDRLKLASGAITNNNTVLTVRTSQAVGIGPANVDPVGTLNILNRRAAASTSLWVGSDQTNTSAAETELNVVEGTVQAATVIVSVLDNAMAATYFAVEAGGNVGVRIANPTVEFHVVGDVLIQSSTDSVTAVQVLDFDGGVPVLNVDTVNERVGIGTAAPTETLEVRRTVTNASISVSTAVANGISRLLLGNPNGTWRVVIDGNPPDFMIENSNTGVEYFFIKRTNGEVGIGPDNITPTGTADFLDRTAATGATEVKIGSDGSGNTSATSTQALILEGQVQGTVNIFDVQNNAETTTYFTVEEAGNVGIGEPDPVEDFEVEDRATLGTESLDFPADFSNAAWALAGEFAIVGTDAVYTFAGGGAGTVTQIQANQAVVAIDGERRYRLQYTISGSTVAGETFTLTAAYANGGLTLDATDGAKEFFFEADTTPVDFVFDIAGATGGAFTLEDASLQQVQGGDVVSRGIVELNSITFEDLPASVDGSMVYCQDCTIASPCAAAGGGGFAKRIGGAWICN